MTAGDNTTKRENLGSFFSSDGRCSTEEAKRLLDDLFKNVAKALENRASIRYCSRM